MLTRRHFKSFFWMAIAIGLVLAASQLNNSPVARHSSRLIINEFMASNQDGLTDEDGDASDWLEIYNAGPQPVNLSGWALTDDPHQPEKWTFPAVTLAGGDYLVVFASGKNRKTADATTPLHTNFKLRKNGEFLGLYNILDDEFASIAAPEEPRQIPGVSFGRYTENAYGYLSTATPGEPNKENLLWQGVVAQVSFSAERGFYDSPLTVELGTTTPEAVIRYTTDSSEPTESHGEIYTKPILIDQTTTLRVAAFKPNFRASTVTTHSYIFLDDVLVQPPDPPGYPLTWGIHDETFKIAVEGEPAPADYEMDPKVVNTPRYRTIIKDHLTAIPSISIVIDKQAWDIYTNPRERGRAWERKASVEWIDPLKIEPGFHINAGIRIQGDAGRREYIPKHSFRLFFRNEYGAGKLKYPLFPDSPVEEFDTLTLRGGVQRSYVGVWDIRREDTTYARDEWLRASQIEMSGFGSHGTFAHLYLNGMYWGLYNVVERPDESFGAAYFDVDPEDWYAFNHDGIVNGKPDEVKTLFADFLSANSPEAKYAALRTVLDTTAFADYLILNWYAGMGDWAHNNWYAGFQKHGGKLKYFVWDGELTWRSGAKIRLGIDNPPGYLWPNTVKLFFDALIQNEDFRLELADRMYKHLYHDGALTDANSKARWLRLNQTIEQAIVGEIARWGDTRQEPPLSYEQWLEAVDKVVNQMEGNGDLLIALAREQEIYPEIDPPLFNQPGGRVDPGFELTMTSPLTGENEAASGRIYFTTDGSDPRVSGHGAAAPGAILYHEPLVLTATMYVKARRLHQGVWSALNEARFRIIEESHPLQITELMYNPPGRDDHEFIELKNNGEDVVELAGLSFEGIRFTFPADTPPLTPGELIVLVRNPEAFAERYPQVSIGGVYEGQLSNDGEQIAVKDAKGSTVTSVTYETENGWPISPDGRGDSLVLIDPTDDLNNAKNWRASVERFGSPGRDEPAQLSYRLHLIQTDV